MASTRSARRHRPTFGELVVALALGFGLWGLTYYGTLEAIGNIRHALDGDEDDIGSPAFQVYELSFHLGDTEIYYGQTLAALVSALILALVALLVVRRRRRATAETCPHCLSEIPTGAAVCASCTRDVAPSVQ